MKKILNLSLILFLCFSAVSCCKMRSYQSVPGAKKSSAGRTDPSTHTGGN